MNPTLAQPRSVTLASGSAAPAERRFSDLGERRGSARRPAPLSACLVPLSGADVIRCITDDVAAGGIHVTIPVGFGVAVGQRYELQMAAPGASLGMGPLLTNPGCYATVVRTRIRLDRGGDTVGVGLRFDKPLLV